MLDDEKFNIVIYKAISDFKGDLGELESAIGMLAIGRRYGWKVLYLMHSKGTIRKYEKLLGLKIREVLSEQGDKTENSVAWKALQKVSNFWKAVSGEISGVRSSEAK